MKIVFKMFSVLGFMFHAYPVFAAEGSEPDDAYIVISAVVGFFLFLFIFLRLLRLVLNRINVKMGWAKQKSPTDPTPKTTQKGLITTIIILILIFGGSFLYLFQVTTKSNITKGAFFLKDIPAPEEIQVTYKNKEGKSLTVPAYEGQIQILVSAGTSARQVKSLVVENGGKIIGQIPIAGIYLAEVLAGTQADVITELLQEPPVLNAFPNVPDMTYVSVQIDAWTENDTSYAYTDAGGKVYYHMLPPEPGGKFLFTTDKKKAATHGDIVRYFLRGKKFEAGERDECYFTTKTCVPMGFFGVYPLAEIIESKKQESYITLNLSFGPKEFDEDGNKFDEAVIQELEKNSLQVYLNLLEREFVMGLDKTILVRAAGNSGTDLTSVFNDLTSRTSRAQEALDRLVVVGAVDANGKLADYSNFSNNPKDMIYVPVKERTQSSLLDGKITITGTSYAAPQITYLINQILDAYPQLVKEPKKLKEVLFHPSVAKLKSAVDPKTGRSHPLRYRIENPYDQKTIKNALEAARRLLGLPRESVPEAESERGETESVVPSKPAPEPTIEKEPEVEAPVPISVKPPPTTVQPVIPSEPMYRLTEDSTSCTLSRTEDGGPFVGPIKFYLAQRSGLAQGPTDAYLNFNLGNNTPGLQIGCGSWTVLSRDQWEKKCVRGSGQPETTSWTSQVELSEPLTVDRTKISLLKPGGYQVGSGLIVGAEIACQ